VRELLLRKRTKEKREKRKRRKGRDKENEKKKWIFFFQNLKIFGEKNKRQFMGLV
jgi:hypothetical protein